MLTTKKRSLLPSRCEEVFLTTKAAKGGLASGGGEAGVVKDQMWVICMILRGRRTQMHVTCTILRGRRTQMHVIYTILRGRRTQMYVISRCGAVWLQTASRVPRLF